MPNPLDASKAVPNPPFAREGSPTEAKSRKPLLHCTALGSRLLPLLHAL
jgi:hypothetical protein